MKYLSFICFILLLCGCEENQNSKEQKEKTTIRTSFYLSTVLHDEHLFILSKYGYFIHHPDCPCFSNKSEKTEQEIINVLPPIILDGSKSILTNP